jgi:hypothetical protein
VAYSLGDFAFSNTFWQGVNGGGQPFIGRFDVHPLSRRTGWLEVELQRGRPMAAKLHPVRLKPNLTVVPHDARARQHEWLELCRLLQQEDYPQLFEAETIQAAQRDKWRMSKMRLLPRLKVKLLKYGCFPGACVEPDGRDWRDSLRMSNRAAFPSPA